MAGSSLLALIDDIASLLDDVAAMSKLAVKKTTGVLGDDLALNAQQVAGIRAERELPVVWAVGLGSLRNKAVLVPAALAISALLPWLILPLLMLGGTYLCYEGFEKLAHHFLHGKADAQAAAEAVLPCELPSEADLLAFEQDKIRGAIRTDFVLSAEIIVITLGMVAQAPLLQQVTVLVGIAVLMTLGVYGLVAAIVKLDDVGFYLNRRQGNSALARLLRTVGAILVQAAPWLMKSLSFVGTAAMFMVGGSILSHGLPLIHDLGPHLALTVSSVPALGGLLALLLPALLDMLIGILAGALALAIVTPATRLWQKIRGPAPG